MKADNWGYIENALNTFEKHIKTCTSVNTGFGVQNPQKGYRIKNICVNENWVRIEIYLENRKIREKDLYVREGDTAYFVVRGNKVEEM